MGKFCKQIYFDKGPNHCYCYNKDNRYHNLCGPAKVNFNVISNVIDITYVTFIVHGMNKLINRGGPNYLNLQNGKINEAYWDYKLGFYIRKIYHSDGSVAILCNSKNVGNKHFVKNQLRDKVQQYYDNIVIPQIKVLFERAEIHGNIV